MANKSNISILQKNDCCGCRACADICPQNCISFLEDVEGFVYPTVDKTTCIKCGKCIRVCPELNPVYNKKAKNVEAAFAKNKTDRDNGSSGGIFGLIAQAIINKGGRVWGAAFDADLKLKHQCAVSIDELPLLYKSKYLQSDTTSVYSIIKKDISKGLLTLFSGTPCQCNAIRNYIGETELLLTLEVVCHGVPSQSLFDKSIKWVEEKEQCKVEKFQFRAKYKNALHPQAYSYIYRKDGKRKQVNGLHYQFPFYFGFQKYITLRPSCYSCKWACPTRCADITLGDFWGIEKYNPELDAKDGISQILINTTKGLQLFENLIAENKIWHQHLPIETALKNNGCLNAPTRLKPERTAFFQALQTEPFGQVISKHLKSKRQWVFDIYYGMPGWLRRIVRKIMDKRMKYE